MKRFLTLYLNCFFLRWIGGVGKAMEIVPKSTLYRICQVSYDYHFDEIL